MFKKCIIFHFSQRYLFEQVMCTLMAPVNPSAAPIPSEEMERGIYDIAKDTLIYHYQDCSGRYARDCKVYNYASAYLRILLNAMTP